MSNNKDSNNVINFNRYKNNRQYGFDVNEFVKPGDRYMVLKFDDEDDNVRIASTFRVTLLEATLLHAAYIYVLNQMAVSDNDIVIDDDDYDDDDDDNNEE